MNAEQKLLECLIGGGGCEILLSGVTYSNLKGVRIVVQHLTEFEIFEINDVDVLEIMRLNEYECAAGCFISIPLNTMITKIKLVTGSVMLYNAV